MATTDIQQIQHDHPQNSPYASPIINLTFGNSPQRWPIHSAFLSRCPKLYALHQVQPAANIPGPPRDTNNSNEPILHLSHADPQTAHTLLHHLTTTKYQPLRADHPTSAYERALLTLCAAGWYELRALRDLALGEVVRLGPAVPLGDALVEIGKAVEQACAREQAVLLEHLEGRLKTEWKADKAVFSSADTWRGFNPFLRTLVGVVMGLQGAKGMGKGGLEGDNADADEEEAEEEGDPEAEDD